jgi:tetratricopeptide (TPR) repeat protein
MEPNVCPDEDLAKVVDLMAADSADAAVAIGALLMRHPDDARLHFLNGSLAASVKDYEAARNAMTEAVRLAPGFAIARYQLGFLEFSMGLPAAASETWGPLSALDEGDPLRLFATGLEHLGRDEFDDATRLLERGIALNHDNAAINADIGLLLNEIRRLSQPDAPSPTSAHFLLQQYGFKVTRH